MLPLECYHGNGYSESVEVVRSEEGKIEGLHLKILVDGESWCVCGVCVCGVWVCVHVGVCVCVCVCVCVGVCV